MNIPSRTSSPCTGSSTNPGPPKFVPRVPSIRGICRFRLWFLSLSRSRATCRTCPHACCVLHDEVFVDPRCARKREPPPTCDKTNHCTGSDVGGAADGIQHTGQPLGALHTEEENHRQFFSIAFSSRATSQTSLGGAAESECPSMESPSVSPSWPRADSLRVSLERQP